MIDPACFDRVNVLKLLAYNDRLRAVIVAIDAQSIATTDPHYVAVPARVLADAVISIEQKAGENQ